MGGRKVVSGQSQNSLFQEMSGTYKAIMQVNFGIIVKSLRKATNDDRHMRSRHKKLGLLRNYIYNIV